VEPTPAEFDTPFPRRVAPQIREEEPGAAKGLKDGAESHDRKLLLYLRVLGPEGELLLDGSGTQTAPVELAEHFLRRADFPV
jgi:hypothetical protein